MGATVFVVLKNQDLTEVLHTVAGMNKIYLGLAIAMAIFLWERRDFCFPYVSFAGRKSGLPAVH